VHRIRFFVKVKTAANNYQPIVSFTLAVGARHSAAYLIMNQRQYAIVPGARIEMQISSDNHVARFSSRRFTAAAG
jgi:hypothetical protein